MAASKSRSTAVTDEDRARVIHSGSLVRPAVLVLLKERRSHGYELLERLAEFGFEEADPSGVYRSLHLMEEEELIESVWEVSPNGPSKRVYRLTRRGHGLLRSLGPHLEERERTVSELLRRYHVATRRKRRGGSSG